MSDRLASRLERAAKEDRITKSELIRDLLSRGLGSDEDESLSAFHLMRNAVGVIASGVDNLATGDEHLEDFGK